MKYIYFIIIFAVVLFLAFHLIPIAFALLRIILGLGIIAVFGLGVWLGTKFTKKDKQ